jgi:hypothetical protein
MRFWGDIELPDDVDRDATQSGDVADAHSQTATPLDQNSEQDEE